MKKQSVLRLLSLFVLMFTMSGQTFAWDSILQFLRNMANRGRDGEMFYSQLTVNAIGDGKVYVLFPTGNEEELSAEEVEAIGDVVSTAQSPENEYARGGRSSSYPYRADTYSDHTYFIYTEPHPGFEVDGIYRDEACTDKYSFSNKEIFEEPGYTAFSVTYRTEATTRAEALEVNLYARFVLNVTINSRGYSTLYYSKYNFKVPSGVTATTYKLGDGYGKLEESRVYSEGDVIPAGEPVVLQGTGGQTYKFYPVKNTLNVPDTDNILLGTDGAEQTASGYDEYFILSYNSTKGVVGFYWKNSDGSGFTNGAHKAYLALGGASGVKGFDLDGDEATGISDVDANVNANGPIFNLAGQRVGKMQKGINIVNGKKFLK